MGIKYLMYYSYTSQTIQGAKNKLAPQCHRRIHNGEVAGTKDEAFKAHFTQLPPPPETATSLVDHKCD